MKIITKKGLKLELEFSDILQKFTDKHSLTDGEVMIILRHGIEAIFMGGIIRAVKKHLCDEDEHI